MCGNTYWTTALQATGHFIYFVLLTMSFSWWGYGGPIQCVTYVYPLPFFFLMCNNIFFNIVELFLWSKNYYKDFTRVDELKRVDDFVDNEKLFVEQTHCFVKMNLFFGLKSAIVLGIAIFILNA